MATQWGRKETIIWPPHAPIMSYTRHRSGVPLHLSVCMAAAPFLAAAAPAVLHLRVHAARGSAAPFMLIGTYRLLYLGGRKAKPRLAFPVDFVPGKMTLPDGKRRVRSRCRNWRRLRATAFRSAALLKSSPTPRCTAGFVMPSSRARASWPYSPSASSRVASALH